MRILAATDRDETARRLAIYWGVVPVRAEVRETADPTGVRLSEQLRAQGFVKPGATLVFVNIHDDISRPDANFLTILRI
jgi:pyruvate kinase